MKRIEYPDAPLPYTLYLPDDLGAQAEWQLIVFLHGRGEWGTDLELSRKHGVPNYLDAGNELPAIVYVPQTPEEVYWYSQGDSVMAGIDALQSTYAISKTHITGFSMGGQGTWHMAVNHPERFASLSPVTTFDYLDDNLPSRVCVLKDTPLWTFHSDADFLPIDFTISLVETLRDCGSTTVKFTRYTDADHVETANLAYDHEDLYKWMLA